MTHKTYTVTITQEVSHEYTVEARTPEEAIETAEQWLHDSEPGNITDEAIVDSDAFESE